MDLQSMFHPESCKANISDVRKQDVLETLADLAMKHPAASGVDRTILLQRLNEREEKGSTGIGSQLAIPHAQVPGLEQFVISMATSQKGIDYESIDGKKARLFFMILAPEGEAASHLKVLANISRTLSLPGVRPEILAAPTELALYEAFISRANPEGTSTLKQKEDMSLLTLILFDKELIYDILEMFLQKGIEGANIADSYGMGEYISNVPLFAGFLGFMNDRTNSSKTLQALIPKSSIDSIVEGIESITGDLDKKQGAALFVTPVQLWKGTMKMM
ncbi:MULTISPECIES: PTS sugar transporter subunit IIA [unclassified Oceanispirochaeta]|uniref:PTS sugar transporter subunit IIA n=1 Tax=unclassified Oceanispirochaeta TaxID=2635722 RepID=UPI000E099B09|nr:MULTISPECIES: PTS sugar transporter subunit IIA [unclassified Oceanispirochaeta]MBF9016348.1 PTS sugar transporter subunit IIA [Oceanispirochaeta sp. M2]NPD72810.1 PTS sugar transporter subunit IIA [Oceanispirochaeta sp. M1]RDG31654.1 PTS sugar transporter subunit IIA [Oceanispirochaeta sp. M1]